MSEVAGAPDIIIHDPEAYEAAGRPGTVIHVDFVRRKIGEVTLAQEHQRVLEYQDLPLPRNLPEAA